MNGCWRIGGAGGIMSVEPGDDLHTAEWGYYDSDGVFKPDNSVTIRYE